MKHWPRITVITPSFNQARFLERTICSVLDQQYPVLEFFVIDGGSTDGSVELIQQYAHQLDWWESTPDGGQTEAINKGLARATGDIIAFINSDDLYMPGTLHTVGERMAGADAPRWLVGKCVHIDEYDEETDVMFPKAPRSFTEYLMRTSGLIPQPSSFWSAELFDQCGTFDEDMHTSFDYEWNCRLLAHGVEPTIIDEPLAAFRVHEAAKGVAQADQFEPARQIVARRYAGELNWTDRVRLYRNLAYRQRLVAIERARHTGRAVLWSDVMRRPWWLVSDEVRAALLDHDAAERKAA